MGKRYLKNLLLFCLLLPALCKSQDCSTLTATFTTYESRCAATGSVKILASGGSGSYKYKMAGPSNSNYTTTDSITGLSAGTYILYINDILNNCTISIPNVVVAGTYQDPRFTLTRQDVTCDNGNNGSITVNDQLYGRGPFQYSIVAPSPSGVGTINASGIFTGLSAGNYSIMMTDSCGGIQTRQITVGNYSWWIDAYPFTKTGCDEATGFIKVTDSRGNISTVSGIPGFMYGVVRSPGDTVWSANAAFSFSLAGQNTFEIIVRDNCGLIKKAPVTVVLQPGAPASATTFNLLCNSFSASLSVTNFFGVDFCLYDINDVNISCNSTGVFNDLAYGSYCIKAHDTCTDTLITRCFTVLPPPISINANVRISDKICTGFTATVTGQTGLNNPTYCLFNGAGVQISCNSTGIFTDLPYEPYCINVHDGCRDTTLSTCFDIHQPLPVLPPVISPGYITCTVFGIVVAGDSTTNPQYCLYDSSGVLITCNSTGIFDSIPFGNYCVTLHDGCIDTTITRCFGVDGPKVINDMLISISNKTCSGFSATVSSHNFITPNYCLYTAADILVACDSTGIFTDIPYGSYCIKATVACPDTTLVSCFTVRQLVPSVAATVTTARSTCTTFSAAITGLVNLPGLTNFCLYDSADVLIGCNATGAFSNLPYGRYCIKITTACYDTTIVRCFSKAAPVVSISVGAARSCTIGNVKFNLTLGGGNLPVNIKVYRPDGSLLMDTLITSNSSSIDNIPGLEPGENYKIVARDNCGNNDSVNIAAIGSYFNHVPAVVAKCPGSSWANGSGNIEVSVKTNLGSLTVRIIQKDGVPYLPALSPDVVTAGVYIFNDLGPGTYIITSTESMCNKKFSDTITINPYRFPNLTRSSAYQCDVNGFSVSAVATDGVGPFSYSIIGSLPSIPSIIAGPQASPIFNINNGATYSLIRLRALDACGNATLGDASILPLVISGIDATLNCLSRPTTLSVDPISNATYLWYKKINPADTDSILVGSAASYFIPDVALADLGWYTCYVSVNAGCLNRVYTYHLTGQCEYVLPVKLLSFSGRTEHEANLLQWQAMQEDNLAHYTLERKNGNDHFAALENILVKNNTGSTQSYNFTDAHAPEGNNFYRLKMVNSNGIFTYSNTVLLNNKKGGSMISIYPNPVKEMLTINFKITKTHRYVITLLNAMNQVISHTSFSTDGSNNLVLPRPVSVKKGIYFIRITDMDSNEIFSEKIIYL